MLGSFSDSLLEVVRLSVGFGIDDRYVDLIGFGVFVLWFDEVEDFEFFLEVP